MAALLMCNAAAAGEDQKKGGIPDPSIATSIPQNGDTDGLRARLAAQGVTYGINYTGDLFGNSGGGASQGTTYNGRAEFVFDGDLEKLAGWKGASVHFNVYQIHGEGLSSHYIGNLMPVGNIDAMATTRLFEAWFEQKFAGDKASLRLGQIAADSEFLISSYGAQFINGTFGWATIAAADLRSGGPAYPLAAPGARLKIEPNSDFTFLGAVFSGDPGGPGDEPDPQKRNRYGLNFGFVDRPLVMLEGQYHYSLGKGAAALPGTIKLGGWEHFGEYENPLTAERLSTNHGFYAVLDQQIFALPGAKDKGIGLFARLAGAPDDRNLIDFYADGGLQFSGFVPKRPDDKFGMAFGYGRVSATAVEADLARDFEAVLELNYSAQIIPGWTVQPDFQYIWHPGGGVPGVSDAAVFGVRTVVNY
jgi:porin